MARRRLLSWPMSVLLIIPILLDTLSQSAGWRESTNPLRAVTGTLGGVGLAGLILRGWAGGFTDGSAESVKLFPPIPRRGLIGLLVLLLLAAGVSEIRGQAGTGSVTPPDRTMCEEFARGTAELETPPETSEGGQPSHEPVACLFLVPLVATEVVKQGLKTRELKHNAQEAAMHACLEPSALAQRLGADDPEVARSLQNLAERHTDLGEQLQKMAAEDLATGKRNAEMRSASEPFFTRAEDRRSLGLTMWKNAESLYWQALAIREKTLGPEHPDVATTLTRYAALLRKKNRGVEADEMEARAESVYKRAVANQETAPGPPHREVATTVESYAALLRQMHRSAEAQEMEARFKEIREEAARARDQRIGQLMVGVDSQVRLKLGESEPSKPRTYAAQENTVIAITAAVRAKLLGLPTDQLEAMTERGVRELIDQVMKSCQGRGVCK
jgi:hypothetical protein